MKAEKGKSKEDCVRPYLQRLERRNHHGVYCIFASMEMGSTFRSQLPKYPTDDPNYRIIRRVPSRYLHYYSYIRDPVIGPLAVDTYLPFQTTYYLNGHNFIEIELRRLGVTFRKDDNAFLSTSDPKALQAAADKLSAATIEKRLNYRTWFPGPKFSRKDCQGVSLRRSYSINQTRILPELHLQTPLPHPQNLRALERYAFPAVEARCPSPAAAIALHQA